jgi:hypothetical protein
MEQRAAHAHAVAAVAEHLAWRERTQADEAQRMLRQCKVLLSSFAVLGAVNYLLASVRTECKSAPL